MVAFLSTMLWAIGFIVASTMRIGGRRAVLRTLKPYASGHFAVWYYFFPKIARRTYPDFSGCFVHRCREPARLSVHAAVLDPTWLRRSVEATLLLQCPLGANLRWCVHVAIRSGSTASWNAYETRAAVTSGVKPDVSCVSHTGGCKHSRCCELTAEESGAGNLHAGFCGNRGRATASGDRVGSVVQRWQAPCATLPGAATEVISAYFSGLPPNPWRSSARAIVFEAASGLESEGWQHGDLTLATTQNTWWTGPEHLMDTGCLFRG